MGATDSRHHIAATLALAALSGAWHACTPYRAPVTPPGETTQSTVPVHRLPRYPAHEGRTIDGCDTEKLEFQRADGCWNNGSVQFCLPSGDVAAEAAVRYIAPEVRCTQGQVGRATCDPDHEVLCLVPTTGADCESPTGPMTPETWEKMCKLSKLSYVKRIVRSFPD